MWKSNLIIALRVLGRNRTISLINIVGLSAALAVVVLCLLFVRHEFSYDSWHEKGDRIFYVHLEDQDPGADFGSFKRNTAWIRPGFREAVRTNVPGIGESILMNRWNCMVSTGETTFQEKLLAVDPAFLTLFTLPLAAGDAATALDDPHSVVLGHETAQTYFGSDVSPRAMLGKRLRMHVVLHKLETTPEMETHHTPTHTHTHTLPTWKDTTVEMELTIAGVLAPLPGPSILHTDVFVPTATTDELQITGTELVAGTGGLFIEIEEGVKPKEMETRLAPLAGEDQIFNIRLDLVPLQGAHFGPEIQGAFASIGSGKIEHCYLLAGLAAVVLLIAAINFVNLALGRAMTRTLEVGLRKAIGATRPQLSIQFLAEAIVVSLIAVAGGMALAELLLPAFNQAVSRQLELEWLSIETGTGAVTLALLVGVFSGFYPAQVISRIHPVRALSRKVPQLGRGRIGRGLIVLQFALSAFLVVVTVTMERQLDFMRTNLGFDGDQVVSIRSKDSLKALQIERLAGEIDSRPGLVRGVAGTRPTPGTGFNIPISIQLGENTIRATGFHVSPDFLRVMGIDLLSGQGFGRSDEPRLRSGILLNETAARLLGPEDLIGRTLTIRQFRQFVSGGFMIVDGSLFGEMPGGDDDVVMTVIGIVEDFHYEDMRHTVGPAFLTAVEPGLQGDVRFTTLFRLDRVDLPAAVEEVKALWERVLPEHELEEVRFLDEAFAARYETERRVGTVMKWISAIALIISCMGLVGLAALAAARRTREIGIRKVLGATTGSVLLLMSREFGWLVVAANAIALPVAFFVLDRWLAFYAYRIDQSPEWFALAGAGVLAVALATVSGQTWLAARTNPADALRYE